MDSSEETRRLGLLGYDEKTETWFIQARASERLVLSRQSLAHLVQLYNTIHRGNGLVLMERKELRRLEELRQRHSETLRDLHLFLDRKRRGGFGRRLGEILTSLIRPRTRGNS